MKRLNIKPPNSENNNNSPSLQLAPELVDRKVYEKGNINPNYVHAGSLYIPKDIINMVTTDPVSDMTPGVSLKDAVFASETESEDDNDGQHIRVEDPELRKYLRRIVRYSNFDPKHTLITVRQASYEIKNRARSLLQKVNTVSNAEVQAWKATVQANKKVNTVSNAEEQAWKATIQANEVDSDSSTGRGAENKELAGVAKEDETINRGTPRKRSLLQKIFNTLKSNDVSAINTQDSFSIQEQKKIPTAFRKQIKKDLHQAKGKSIEKKDSTNLKGILMELQKNLTLTLEEKRLLQFLTMPIFQLQCQFIIMPLEIEETQEDNLVLNSNNGNKLNQSYSKAGQSELPETAVRDAVQPYRKTIEHIRNKKNMVIKKTSKIKSNIKLDPILDQVFLRCSKNLINWFMFKSTLKCSKEHFFKKIKKHSSMTEGNALKRKLLNMPIRLDNPKVLCLEYNTSKTNNNQEKPSKRKVSKTVHELKEFDKITIPTMKHELCYPKNLLKKTQQFFNKNRLSNITVLKRNRRKHIIQKDLLDVDKLLLTKRTHMKRIRSQYSWKRCKFSKQNNHFRSRINQVQSRICKKKTSEFNFQSNFEKRNFSLDEYKESNRELFSENVEKSNTPNSNLLQRYCPISSLIAYQGSELDNEKESPQNSIYSDEFIDKMKHSSSYNSMLEDQNKFSEPTVFSDINVLENESSDLLDIPNDVVSNLLKEEMEMLQEESNMSINEPILYKAVSEQCSNHNPETSEPSKHSQDSVEDCADHPKPVSILEDLFGNLNIKNMKDLKEIQITDFDDKTFKLSFNRMENTPVVKETEATVLNQSIVGDKGNLKKKQEPFQKSILNDTKQKFEDGLQIDTSFDKSNIEFNRQKYDSYKEITSSVENKTVFNKIEQSKSPRISSFQNVLGDGIQICSNLSESKEYNRKANIISKKIKLNEMQSNSSINNAKDPVCKQIILDKMQRIINSNALLFQNNDRGNNDHENLNSSDKSSFIHKNCYTFQCNKSDKLTSLDKDNQEFCKTSNKVKNPDDIDKKLEHIYSQKTTCANTYTNPNQSKIAFTFQNKLNADSWTQTNFENQNSSVNNIKNEKSERPFPHSIMQSNWHQKPYEVYRNQNTLWKECYESNNRQKRNIDAQLFTSKSNVETRPEKVQTMYNIIPIMELETKPYWKNTDNSGEGNYKTGFPSSVVYPQQIENSNIYNDNTHCNIQQNYCSLVHGKTTSPGKNAQYKFPDVYQIKPQECTQKNQIPQIGINKTHCALNPNNRPIQHGAEEKCVESCCESQAKMTNNFQCKLCKEYIKGHTNFSEKPFHPKSLSFSHLQNAITIQQSLTQNKNRATHSINKGTHLPYQNIKKYTEILDNKDTVDEETELELNSLQSELYRPPQSFTNQIPHSTNKTSNSKYQLPIINKNCANFSRVCDRSNSLDEHPCMNCPSKSNQFIIDDNNVNVFDKFQRSKSQVINKKTQLGGNEPSSSQMYQEGITSSNLNFQETSRNLSDFPKTNEFEECNKISKCALKSKKNIEIKMDRLKKQHCPNSSHGLRISQYFKSSNVKESSQTIKSSRSKTSNKSIGSCKHGCNKLLEDRIETNGKVELMQPENINLLKGIQSYQSIDMPHHQRNKFEAVKCYHCLPQSQTSNLTLMPTDIYNNASITSNNDISCCHHYQNWDNGASIENNNVSQKRDTPDIKHDCQVNTKLNKEIEQENIIEDFICHCIEVTPFWETNYIQEFLKQNIKYEDQTLKYTESFSEAYKELVNFNHIPFVFEPLVVLTLTVPERDETKRGTYSQYETIFVGEHDKKNSDHKVKSFDNKSSMNKCWVCTNLNTINDDNLNYSIAQNNRESNIKKVSFQEPVYGHYSSHGLETSQPTYSISENYRPNQSQNQFIQNIPQVPPSGKYNYLSHDKAGYPSNMHFLSSNQYKVPRRSRNEIVADYEGEKNHQPPGNQTTDSSKGSPGNANLNMVDKRYSNQEKPSSKDRITNNPNIIPTDIRSNCTNCTISHHIYYPTYSQNNGAIKRQNENTAQNPNQPFVGPTSPSEPQDPFMKNLYIPSEYNYSGNGRALSRVDKAIQVSKYPSTRQLNKVQSVTSMEIIRETEGQPVVYTRQLDRYDRETLTESSMRPNEGYLKSLGIGTLGTQKTNRFTETDGLVHNWKPVGRTQPDNMVSSNTTLMSNQIHKNDRILLNPVTHPIVEDRNVTLYEESANNCICSTKFVRPKSPYNITQLPMAKSAQTNESILESRKPFIPENQSQNENLMWGANNEYKIPSRKESNTQSLRRSSQVRFSNKPTKRRSSNLKLHGKSKGDLGKVSTRRSSATSERERKSSLSKIEPREHRKSSAGTQTDLNTKRKNINNNAFPVVNIICPDPLCPHTLDSHTMICNCGNTHEEELKKKHVGTIMASHDNIPIFKERKNSGNQTETYTYNNAQNTPKEMHTIICTNLKCGSLQVSAGTESIKCSCEHGQIKSIATRKIKESNKETQIPIDFGNRLNDKNTNTTEYYRPSPLAKHRGNLYSDQLHLNASTTTSSLELHAISNSDSTIASCICHSTTSKIKGNVERTLVNPNINIYSLSKMSIDSSIQNTNHQETELGNKHSDSDPHNDDFSISSSKQEELSDLSLTHLKNAQYNVIDTFHCIYSKVDHKTNENCSCAHCKKNSPNPKCFDSSNQAISKTVHEEVSLDIKDDHLKEDRTSLPAKTNIDETCDDELLLICTSNQLHKLVEGKQIKLFIKNSDSDKKKLRTSNSQISLARKKTEEDLNNGKISTIYNEAQKCFLKINPLNVSLKAQERYQDPIDNCTSENQENSNFSHTEPEFHSIHSHNEILENIINSSDIKPQPTSSEHNTAFRYSGGSQDSAQFNVCNISCINASLNESAKENDFVNETFLDNSKINKKYEDNKYGNISKSQDLGLKALSISKDIVPEVNDVSSDDSEVELSTKCGLALKDVQSLTVISEINDQLHTNKKTRETQERKPEEQTNEERNIPNINKLQNKGSKKQNSLPLLNHKTIVHTCLDFNNLPKLNQEIHSIHRARDILSNTSIVDTNDRTCEFKYTRNVSTNCKNFFKRSYEVNNLKSTLGLDTFPPNKIRQSNNGFNSKKGKTTSCKVLDCGQNDFNEDKLETDSGEKPSLQDFPKHQRVFNYNYERHFNATPLTRFKSEDLLAGKIISSSSSENEESSDNTFLPKRNVKKGSMKLYTNRNNSVFKKTKRRSHEANSKELTSGSNISVSNKNIKSSIEKKNAVLIIKPSDLQLNINSVKACQRKRNKIKYSHKAKQTSWRLSSISSNKKKLI